MISKIFKYFNLFQKPYFPLFSNLSSWFASQHQNLIYLIQ